MRNKNRHRHLPMAYLRNKEATGECTAALIYIACKLMMSRRTPRINRTTVADSSDKNGFAVEHGCVSFPLREICLHFECNMLAGFTSS